MTSMLFGMPLGRGVAFAASTIVPCQRTPAFGVCRRVSCPGYRQGRRRTTPYCAATAVAPGGALGDGADGAPNAVSLRRFGVAATRLSTPGFWRAIAAVSVCVLCGVLSPLGVGLAINSIVQAASRPGPEAAAAFFRSWLKVVALFACECTARFLYVRNMTSVVDSAVLQLRADAMRSIQGVDASFFDDKRSSELAEVISGDCSRIRSLIWGVFRRDRGVTAFSDAILGICIVLYVSPILAAVYLCMIPVVGYVSARTSLKVANLAEAEATWRGRAVSRATEALSSWKTVLSFGAGAREAKTFRDGLLEVDAGVSASLRPCKARDDFFGRFAICLVLAAFLCIGGWLVSYGYIPLRQYLSAQPYLWSISFATQGVIYSLSDMEEVRRLLRKVYSATDRASAATCLTKASDGNTLSTVHGHIEFRDVTFAYPTRPTVKVLENFCLSIEAGQTTALVARSGMGKTTISALLARFYAPQEGEILLDGVDISTLDRTWYSEQIGIVSQHPVLFSGTTAEAIAYGMPDNRQPVSHARIVEAAKLANAHDFIMALPDGYDTEVGERGSRFSGGQLQRIAIARAIVRNSPVLLLDEATSALDADSEKRVQEALEHLSQGKTVLVIAHRLSTIRKASKIVVLGSDGIVESGTYEELMAARGAFANLMTTQTTMLISE